MKAFKAYDIRGVYPRDWNREDAYRIGFFLPRLLDTKEFLVGRDVRLSSDEIFSALTQGLADAGAVAYDLGLTTTPMVYWATARKGFKASVQITASHNSKEYNGMKVSTTDALPVGYDAGLKKIEHWMKTENPIPVSCGGGVRNLDIREDYLAYLKEFVPDLSGLNVAIDLSNGMAAFLVPDLLGDLPIYLNAQPDGNFPGHDPNPLNPKNLHQLTNQVRAKKCDVGVIFDGDADRVMFVDENGSFISPDLMIALLAEHYLKSGRQERVLIDIRTSRSVKERLEELGAEVHTWRVGRAYASPELRRIDGLLGGELAGHYYFKDFYYSDSGILAALVLLKIIREYKMKGVPLSQLIASLNRYKNSGEVNYTIADKEGAIKALTEYFITREKPLSVMDFDGVRLDYKNWWFNVRPSNTEPYLRFIAEANSQELLDDIMGQVREILKSFD